MIPKIIHYCWFGGKKKPKYVTEYIREWRRILHDYEIIEWNENNFDVHSNLFTKQAYENGKHAFVSDYVRLNALLVHGGIYLDSDVQVLKTFNGLLMKNGFIGFEGERHVGMAVVGAERGNVLIGQLLNYYQNRCFALENGEFDETPNTHIVSKIFIHQGLLINNEHQTINNLIEVFPEEYFSAKSFSTGEIITTSNTICIHHFACSWFPWHLQVRLQLSYRFKALKRIFTSQINFKDGN